VAQWLWKIPWSRKWQLTAVILLEDSGSHQQRSLARYSPQGHKESDLTAHMDTHCTLLLFSCSVVSSSLQPHGCSIRASLSFTISWSLLKVMSIESVMPFSHLLLCHPLLLLYIAHAHIYIYISYVLYYIHDLCYIYTRLCIYYICIYLYRYGRVIFV